MIFTPQRTYNKQEYFKTFLTFLCDNFFIPDFLNDFKCFVEILESYHILFHF